MNAIHDNNHPGFILNKFLDDRGISQKEFCLEIGIAVSQFNEIIKGKRNITTDLALLLEAALNKDALYWLDLQSKYNLHKSRIEQENLNKVQLVKKWKLLKEIIPINYLKKYNIIKGDPSVDIEKLKRIFKVSEDDELINLQVPEIKFKISDKFKVNQNNLHTYIKTVDYLRNVDLENNKVNIFSIKNESQLIIDLKNCFLKNKILDSVKYILNQVGIVFIVQEKPDQVPVDGMAFLIDKNPTIVISLRHKRIDNIAFTIFHELGHIILNHLNNKNLIIDDMDSKDNSAEEKAANEFAENSLIPPIEWKNFLKSNLFFDDYTIIRFADEVNTHPAIVRGRLCNESKISYKSKTNIPNKLN